MMLFLVRKQESWHAIIVKQGSFLDLLFFLKFGFLLIVVLLVFYAILLLGKFLFWLTFWSEGRTKV